MPRFSDHQIITLIQNGDDQILFYLGKKYYQSARRWLRRNGFTDKDTPSIFSSIIVSIYREIQQSKTSPNIDFEQYFFNSLRDYSNQYKSNKNHPVKSDPADREREIIGSCYSILDESSRSILAARYVEKLSFEQIAARHNFSNPMIAQFEFNKAFSQFEKISKARINPGE